MRAELLGRLEEVIQQFVEENCDLDIWPDLFWPDNGSELVAKAASLIIDSFESENRCIRDETQDKTKCQKANKD